jgi:KEOPS complex subunit Pcc1
LETNLKLCLGKYSTPIYTALLAEVNQPSPEKGTVSIGLEEDCIVLHIKSETISGLRALINSFLLLVHASYSSLKASGAVRLN